MLTSALGLREIPHLLGPVGIEQLRNNIAVRAFPDVTQLPVKLVPGVRTGVPGTNAWDIGNTDVIRGEETLCMGLIAHGVLRSGSMLLNLGSHWKAINMNQDCWIDQCLTNISGEMMFMLQTQTILASSVLAGRPSKLDEAWVRHGIAEERSSGLLRALFCVRLLELDSRTSPMERLSYLVGGFISHSLSALVRKAMLRDHIVICGAVSIAGAWKLALEEYGAEVVGLFMPNGGIVSSWSYRAFWRGRTPVAGECRGRSKTRPVGRSKCMICRRDWVSWTVAEATGDVLAFVVCPMFCTKIIVSVAQLSG